MNLVKQHLCGTRLCYHFDLVRRDDFAARWEVRVKCTLLWIKQVVGEGVSFEREMVARRRLGLDAMILASSFYGL